MVVTIRCCAAVALLTGAVVNAAPPKGEKPTTSANQKKRKDNLADRLLRKAQSDQQEGVMESIVRLMDEASRRMGVDFDAGSKTTEIQIEIAEKLDEAIERAAKQSRSRRRSSSRSNRDKRKMPTASRDRSGSKRKSPAEQVGSDPAKSTGGEGTAEQVNGQKGEFTELRRGWGQLPSRERDELIQGIDEQFLDRYRDWIERYYRALQELDE